MVLVGLDVLLCFKLGLSSTSSMTLVGRDVLPQMSLSDQEEEKRIKVGKLVSSNQKLHRTVFPKADFHRSTRLLDVNQDLSHADSCRIEGSQTCHSGERRRQCVELRLEDLDGVSQHVFSSIRDSVRASSVTNNDICCDYSSHSHKEGGLWKTSLSLGKEVCL